MNPSAFTRIAIVSTCVVALLGCYSRSAAEERRAVASGGFETAPDTISMMPAPAPREESAPRPAQPAAKPAAPKHVKASAAHQLRGFEVFEAEGGRLWVFRSGSDGLESFLTKGEPAKRVTQIGTGPGGVTLLGSETADLDDYAHTMRYRLSGYAVVATDGRLWVFEDGSEHYKSFLSKGEPAKRVTLVGAGPDGKTLMGADKGVLEAYAATARFGLPGFAVHAAEGGRLWVFKSGSEYHETFLTKGEPAKRVTLVAQGPEGRTLLGSDTAVMKDFADSWRYARPGFVVVAHDGRLWVFYKGSAAYEMFKTKGEPAKRVTLIGEGPDGRTLLGAEKSTLQAYARAN